MIAVVEDTISVLELLLQVQRPLSLAEITERSGFVKNKVFRILATLHAHRLVVRDEYGKYSLGLRFVEFGESVQNRNLIIQAASSVMNRLVEETQETIFLGVMDGMEALVIAVRESPRSVRLFGAVGRRAPLYTGGVPKILLAFLPEDEREAMLNQLDLEPVTPYTITDREELVSYLDQIRKRGYVVTADDLDVGAVSIAAPVRNYEGKVVAAMSVAGPLSRFTDANRDQYVRLILWGTREVSRSLGFIP
jgi:IclR family KDG regulon transcriptional repressor